MVTFGNRWSDPVIYNRLGSTFQRRNAAVLASLTAPRLKDEARVADLGCGTGFLSECLLELKHDVHITCVDVSKDMLASARQSPMLQSCEFVERSMLDYTLVDVDAVISNAAVHWVAPSIPLLMQRVSNSLASGGFTAVGTAGSSAASVAFDEKIASLAKRVRAEEDVVRFSDRRLTVAQAERIATAVGLIVEDAFLIERKASMSVGDYVNWLVASGGPWQAFSPDSSDLRANATEIFAQDDGMIEVGHWTTILIASKG